MSFVFAEHLPALQVVIPLLAAPLCVLIGSAPIALAMTVLVSGCCVAIALALLNTVLEVGPISYALGGWAAPWGIEYRVDTVNAFVLLIVAGISTAAALYSVASVEREIERAKRCFFYTAWLLCLTGLLGITITGDAFNLFVFLEISSLATYLLISTGATRRALTASLRYLIMGTVGATFILIGVGLLYVMTGTLNMADLAVRIPEVANSRTVISAFAFLTVGIALKMALFPFYAWLPNAYAYAPSVVAALLAGTATKVAVYVLLRFFFTIFGAEFSFSTMQLDKLLLPLALTAIVVASTVAVFQNNLKRMLAYSSVAQIGYMTLGISFVSVNGLTGAIVHLFNHALMKAALFMALGCVVYRLGACSLENMNGLGRRMPLTMAAFVVGGLSLIGVPLTAGFVSKWYLILAALEQGWWPVAFLIVASSLIAVVYVWRVVEHAYFKEPTQGSIQQKAKEAPIIMLIPMWTLVVATIYFGVNTSLTVGVAARAAGDLLGLAP